MDNPLWAKATAESTSLLDLWHRQVKQHHGETFRGVGLQKFPQDLWTYEKILWQVKPTVVFEIGVNNGGFTLWLADRLRSLHLHAESGPDKLTPWPKVVGVDIDIAKAQAQTAPHEDLTPYIVLEQADAAQAAELTAIAQRHTTAADRVLVIEDSAHVYATTKAALEALSSLVSIGSYFVVEDGCIDFEHLREWEDWPRGVMQAVEEFLAADRRFVQDEIGDFYTITCHPGGFLRRVA